MGVKVNQVYPSTNETRATSNDPTAEQTPVASATQEVAQTAKEHVREVGDEVATQTRHLTGQIRNRLTDEAESQNERLSSSLRQLSEELGSMGSQAKQDSLAATVVQRLSEGSRQVADYLEQHGPDGVMREVQDFARRKPGTFLLTAAAAGFVAGRLGKGMLTGGSSDGSDGSNGNGYGTRHGSDYRTGYGSDTPTAPTAVGRQPMPAPPVPGDISGQLTNASGTGTSTGTGGSTTSEGTWR
jgi:hypothetical protein